MAEGQGNRVKQEKQKDVRMTNILAAKAVAEAIRTSLGPRGMDKMIKDAQGEVTITNDGATIMSKIDVVHPAAKMLVELSKAQDIEAGDGTTTVVIIAGALLSQAQYLLDKGIHPSVIVDNYQKAADKAVEILEEISIKLELNDQEALVRAAATSLSSKVICQHSQQLAPLAVRAVLAITDINKDTNVDVKNIKINKKLGGTLEDSEMIDGLVFTENKISHQAGGPSKIVNPKIGIIQFCLSQPKTDIENNVTISDYAAMDRLLREERKYILELCKKIAATGCNLLLIQKSIVKDATNDLSLHYLAKAKIMVIKDIDREPLQFYAKTLGAQPVAHIDYFTPEKLGKAALVEEVHQGGEGKYIKITGIQANQQKTVSILLRGTSNLILDEAERSLHDALCVVRSLIKKRALLPGGGAPEMEVSQKLEQLAHQQCKGLQQVVWRAFAEALEVIPYTLAENAGLDPITIVTELRNKHAQGDKFAGINVRQGIISDIVQESVVQPLLVTTSAITLATECVRMILKIDDVLQVVSIMD